MLPMLILFGVVEPLAPVGARCRDQPGWLGYEVLELLKP